MPTKKKFKLKKKFKKLLIILFSISILAFGGIKIFNQINYSKTLDYKLEKKVYDKNTMELIKKKLFKKHKY